MPPKPMDLSPHVIDSPTRPSHWEGVMMEERGLADRVVVATPERASSAPRVLDRRTPFADLPELLSPEEFRAAVGIGRTALYDALRRGEIRHLKFGRTIRIPKTALK
jgi:excisionase family DNA binding protein